MSSTIHAPSIIPFYLLQGSARIIILLVMSCVISVYKTIKQSSTYLALVYMRWDLQTDSVVMGDVENKNKHTPVNDDVIFLTLPRPTMRCHKTTPQTRLYNLGVCSNSSLDFLKQGFYASGCASGQNYSYICHNSLYPLDSFIRG
jgi:hypothetical protein